MFVVLLSSNFISRASDFHDSFCERSEQSLAKGWEARTNITKQAGTFWQDELASFRVAFFWGRLGGLYCRASENRSEAKK